MQAESGATLLLTLAPLLPTQRIWKLNISTRGSLGWCAWDNAGRSADPSLPMKVARESHREVAKRGPSPAAAFGAAAALGCCSWAAGQLWCSSAAQLRCGCAIVEWLWYGLACSPQELWNRRMLQAMAFFSAHQCAVSKCIFTTHWTSSSERSKVRNQFFLPSDLTSSKEMANGRARTTVLDYFSGVSGVGCTLCHDHSNPHITASAAHDHAFNAQSFFPFQN